MSGEHYPEWVIDPETPSVARMYDYYLGGKDNFAADQVAAAMPNVPEFTRANRRRWSSCAHSSLPVNGEPFFGGTMLAMDPPGHTRMRALMAKAFTGRRAEKLRPRIQEIADGLLDGIAARSEADLIEEFAVPLPIQVICELLGVPASDRARFREWTAVLTVPALTSEARKRRREVALAFNGYLTEVIAERRAAPGRPDQRPDHRPRRGRHPHRRRAAHHPHVGISRSGR